MKVISTRKTYGQQQQRPELPPVTYTRYGSKYKVQKLYQRYALISYDDFKGFLSLFLSETFSQRAVTHNAV